MMGAPLVSILLITRDGARTIPGVLAALATQEVSFSFEIVVIDSGSRDGTLDLVRPVAHRLTEIAPATFNHGATRNLGIAACRGAFVVLLVQDAEPAAPSWLARLVTPLCKDESLAGTYARQSPQAGASAVGRAYLARYAAASPEPRVQAVASREAFSTLTPAERLAVCTFDNVCSCVRRSVWEQHPFATTRIAEDVEWARDVMLAGYRLAYVPSAVVRHTHDRPARYELMRTYILHQRLRELFGLRTVPTLAHLARSIGVSTVSHVRWVSRAPAPARARFAQVPRALALAVALPLGQYLGARSVDAGRELLRAQGV